MDKPSKHFYEFDAFRIDVGDRQLLQNGTRIALTPKVFDILLVLVENCGRTVGKEELMHSVWADSFVEEGNLNRNVSTLRKILSDDRLQPRFIRTAPKIGYSFVGDVHEVWEDDETLLIENRTRYHLAVREEKQKSSFVSRVALVSGVVVSVLIVTFAWLWSQTPKNEASSIDRARGTQNQEAYELYEKGRALWRSRSGEDLHQATMLLEQAIRLDPNFARARAALADAYAFDYTNWRMAEAEAREAIRLDPTLGEPHASIGFVRTFWEWRLREAEDEFKQAIQLSPQYATAHQWYASMLVAVDRRNAADAEIKTALDLEPESPAINSDMCQMLYLQHRYDEAISQCDRSLEIDSRSYNAHRHLYEIYSTTGRFDEAIEHFLEAESSAGSLSTQEMIENLSKTYRDSDMHGFRRELIGVLTVGAQPQSYRIAQTYARLGDKEAALRWLANSYERHEFEFLFFYVDPAFAELRGDRRYEEFIGKLLPT